MKKLLFGEAKDGIKAGIDKTANAIKLTLGAKGKTVLISPLNKTLRITKDGVSVAKEVSLEDPVERVGEKIVRQASEKTAEGAGDGTTTTALLVQAIVSESLPKVVSGADPILLKSGIDKAVKVVVENLKKEARPIKDQKDIEHVASISANDQEIGSLLGKIFTAIGKDGVVTIEESAQAGYQVEVVNGLQIDKGYASGYFVTNEKLECVLEDALVLITDQKVNNFADLIPVLDEMLKSGKNTIFLIADDFDDAVLNTLIANRIGGKLRVLAVKAPSFGEKKKEHLQDICAVTGAKLITEAFGKKLKDTKLTDLGEVKKVVSKKDETIVIGGAGEKSEVDFRLSQIKSQLEGTGSDMEKDDLRSRIAKLSGGVSVIRVGGATEEEVKEKKDRVEDAVCATKAALEEGILPGGGIALLSAKKELETTELVGDEKKGWDAVSAALESPFMTILANGGENGTKVLEKLNEGEGYNIRTGKIEKDMIKAGIIDPLKVVRLCIENSASLAGLFLISGAFIVEEKDGKEA